MITIKTKLSAGIYKSEGGGEVRTRYEFTTGPRNLMKAIETLYEHRKSMERSYGNIGCGRSWLEIDGVEVRAFDLDDVMRDDAEAYGERRPSAYIKTKTEKARGLIETVKAGGYDINLYERSWDDVAL